MEYDGHQWYPWGNVYMLLWPLIYVIVLFVLCNIPGFILRCWFLYRLYRSTQNKQRNFFNLSFPASFASKRTRFVRRNCVIATHMHHTCRDLAWLRALLITSTTRPCKTYSHMTWLLYEYKSNDTIIYDSSSSAVKPARLLVCNCI